MCLKGVCQNCKSTQRRIFIFGALGYFKLGALLEGSRRLMSYKLALPVLVTFTEQVVPLYKPITLFWITSTSGTETVIMKLTKKPPVKLSGNTPVTYLLSSLCNCTVCKCQEFALNQGSGTYGSRVRCGSFDDGIWLAWYFVNTIDTNETFSVIFHLPDCKAISNTTQH